VRHLLAAGVSGKLCLPHSRAPFAQTRAPLCDLCLTLPLAPLVTQQWAASWPSSTALFATALPALTLSLPLPHTASHSPCHSTWRLAGPLRDCTACPHTATPLIPLVTARGWEAGPLRDCAPFAGRGKAAQQRGHTRRRGEQVTVFKYLDRAERERERETVGRGSAACYELLLAASRSFVIALCWLVLIADALYIYIYIYIYNI
jgi:hypothetical protein